MSLNQPKNTPECCLPAPFEPNDYDNENTYYQILLIDFKKDANSQSNISWKTKLITKIKKDFSDQTKYPLDDITKTKIKKSYIDSDESIKKEFTTIGSTLPSPGSMLNKGLIKTLLGDKKAYSPIELNNFYESFRTLLHTRKMSQLIAKTWQAQLEAADILKNEIKDQENAENSITNLLELAIKEQTKIKKHITKKIKKEIVVQEEIRKIFDGLVARELFLLSSSSEPDILEPKNLDAYYPLRSRSEPNENNARFLILPNSKGWQSLGLSLLMAGQVYYYTDKDGNFLVSSEQDNKTEFFKRDTSGALVQVDETDIRYHQVHQSILSTGEIVMKYALDVSWNLYKGDIKELDVRSNTSSPAYLAVLPYPAIPSEINLSHERITEWATAGDIPDGKNKFPFYITEENDADKYLIGVQNYTPPYPYLPSSCC